MASLGSWWWLSKAALAALFIGYALRLNVVRRKTLTLLGVVAMAYPSGPAKVETDVRVMRRAGRFLTFRFGCDSRTSGCQRLDVESIMS
jgi:hypothetical protein